MFPFAPSHAQTPQYESDQPHFTQVLNDFWTLQGLGQTTSGIKANWGALLGSSDWYEWNSLKIAWSSDLAEKAAQRDLLLHANITGVNAKGTQAVGYVWPSNGSEAWLCPSPHFDQMPRFICGVYNDYVWSRDRIFVQKMQPRLEAVMDYMTHTMQGWSGLLVCPGVYNGLPNQGPNTTYMDCYREGGQVTWIEEEYYTALWDMAALETVLGHKARAAAYAALARRLPKQFDAHLWNPKTRRYVGWKDSRGTLHDYGFTYLNLEALARGLGTAPKAFDIFDWLDHGTAQPTKRGGHIGSKEIYQCVVAPRSNTISIPDADWDFWSVSKSLRRSSMGYGALVEDGGALVWVNYYDVMARLKWLDADSAWRKFADMLYRVESDPLRFTESVTHPTNVYGENYLEVGPADGPENGLNGTASLCGFMGIHANLDGVYASPNLPTSLLFLRSNPIGYGSAAYTIQVSRGKVVTNSTEQVFTAPAAFNKIGVCVTAADGSNAGLTLKLQKRRGAGWITVASSAVTMRNPLLYDYVSVPMQPAGKYQVIVQSAKGAVLALRGNGIYSCRAVYEPTTSIAAAAISHAGNTFAAKRAFSEIAVQTSRPVSGSVFLSRQFGVHWRPVAATWAAGNGSGILSFADQPAGFYRLQFATTVTGAYMLFSHRYTIIVTNGTISHTRTVAAGGTIPLDLRSLL